MKKLKTWFWGLLVLTFIITALPVSAAAASLDTLKTIGFDHITLPDNIANDEFMVKAIYFATKEEARRIKNVKLDYDDRLPRDAYVKGYIEYYSLDAKWREPHANTTNKELSSREYKYTDNKGKEHKATIKDMTTVPVDVPGGYEFTAYVTATLQLVDAKTEQVLVEYHKTESNDKTMDAYREILKGFYKMVNKDIKEIKKQSD